MSPERFKQHLGELVVCYGFVVFPSSEFEILDVYETERNCCSEFRMLSQHDVVKWNLQKRLGACLHLLPCSHGFALAMLI